MATSWTKVVAPGELARSEAIDELRKAVYDEIITRRKLGTATWAEMSLQGNYTRKSHINEIAAQIDKVSPSGVSVNTGDIMKATAVTLMREKVNSFEDTPSTGTGNNTCQNGCVGLCVSCTGTCTGDCTSSCSRACNNNCIGGCTGDCWRKCNNSCSVRCANSCNDDCYGSCDGGCKSSCTNSCTGSCTGSCNGGCRGSCADRCAVCSGGCSTMCNGCKVKGVNN